MEFDRAVVNLNRFIEQLAHASSAAGQSEERVVELEEACSRQPEMDAAVDAVDHAVRANQQPAADGQELAERGVSAVKEAMKRLLGEAQMGLGRMHQYLGDLRDDQEKAVLAALSGLESASR
jgi:hypothetical protein